MRAITLTNTATDLTATTHPFVQGATVVAIAPAAAKLQGSNDGTTWTDIGATLTAGLPAERSLGYRYVKSGTTDVSIGLLAN